MEELNITGKTVLSTTQLGIKFDRQVKKVLACKPILAFILQAVVEECRGMTIQEVEKCIEGEIRVEQVLVDPGLTNTEVVRGDMNEDSVPGEGMGCSIVQECSLPSLELNFQTALMTRKSMTILRKYILYGYAWRQQVKRLIPLRDFL